MAGAEQAGGGPGSTIHQAATCVRHCRGLVQGRTGTNALGCCCDAGAHRVRPFQVLPLHRAVLHWWVGPWGGASWGALEDGGWAHGKVLGGRSRPLRSHEPCSDEMQSINHCPVRPCRPLCLLAVVMQWRLRRPLAAQWLPGGLRVGRAGVGWACSEATELLEAGIWQGTAGASGPSGCALALRAEVG